MTYTVKIGWTKDATMKYELNLKDGKLDGPWKGWSKDGTPAFEVNYKEDKQHGAYKRWYPDGTLEYEYHYRNGVEVHRSAEVSFS